MRKQLIIAARNGDEAAFSELSSSYKPLIESMTDKYAGLTESFGTDKEDVRQEVSFAFYKAVMTYDAEQEKVSFGLYAKICIRNRLISLLRTLNKRPKTVRRAKNEAAQKKEPSLDRDELASLSDSVLSKTEKAVFMLYADGKSYEVISKMTGKSLKSVDNALYRAKRKLRLHISGK